MNSNIRNITHDFWPHGFVMPQTITDSTYLIKMVFFARQIHGMVRVVMRPLITKMPLVGGLQVFFLNNPSIDFNLVGAADVLDMPGFR